MIFHFFSIDRNPLPPLLPADNGAKGREGKKLFYGETIGREIMRAKKKPGLNAAKTKRATAAPDLRILSLY